MFNKGDKVTVLDDVINGVVLSVNEDEVMVETEEGFELSFKAKELLRVDGQDNLLKNDTYSIDQIVREKETPKLRSFVKEKKSKKDEFVLEIDLHIEKLVSNKRRMSNHDILTIQIETAKRQIEFAILKRIPKMVFIHGVGEGVLKAELDFILGRYDNIFFQDANYQKYGAGATEVYIKQNVK